MGYEDSIKKLYERFPGFTSSPELEGCDRNLTYPVYAGFARYFNRIASESKGPTKNAEIKDICLFLDEMANSEDKKTVDLLAAGFFEAVVNEKDEITERTLNILNKLLGDKSKWILKQVTEWKPPVSLNGFMLEDTGDTE